MTQLGDPECLGAPSRDPPGVAVRAGGPSQVEATFTEGQDILFWTNSVSATLHVPKGERRLNWMNESHSTWLPPDNPVT